MTRILFFAVPIVAALAALLYYLIVTDEQFGDPNLNTKRGELP